MRLDQVHYLSELATSGSIHAAARNLNLSYQNLSAYLKKLEKELGTKLFEKSAKGIALTAD